jgi:hypothetical protein
VLLHGSVLGTSAGGPPFPARVTRGSGGSDGVTLLSEAPRDSSLNEVPQPVWLPRAVAADYSRRMP